MKAHDVRHLRVCKGCGGLGDRRRMLDLHEAGPHHDFCAVERFGADAMLELPASERRKISIGAAGTHLMRRLLDLEVPHANSVRNQGPNRTVVDAGEAGDHVRDASKINDLGASGLERAKGIEPSSDGS